MAYLDHLGPGTDIFVRLSKVRIREDSVKVWMIDPRGLWVTACCVVWTSYESIMYFSRHVSLQLCVLSEFGVTNSRSSQTQTHCGSMTCT